MPGVANLGTMSASRTVLMIGADPSTSQVVAAHAETLSCAFMHAASAAGALQSVGRCRPDLVVLDISLPAADGLALCSQIRSLGETLLLVLIGGHDPMDRIAAIEHGADDCLMRPFNPRELLARMQALLRRAQLVRAQRPDGCAAMEDRYVCGNMAIDPMKRLVTVGERKVDLRQREFDLLLALVQRAGTVVTREELLRHVWGFEYPIAGGTVDVHVHRLRRKLGQNGQAAAVIETVWGVGFRFPEEVAISRR